MAVHLISTTTTSAPRGTNERWRPGLRAIEWLGPKLSPEWGGPMDYWNDFLDDPPIIFL